LALRGEAMVEFQSDALHSSKILYTLYLMVI
jgi:hypothetical protein